MSNITFKNEVGPGIEVLKISKEGIWANPDVPVDQAAQAVLSAIDNNIKVLVQRAVEAEREACAKVCEDEIARVKPIYSVTAENCVKAIRARGKK